MDQSQLDYAWAAGFFDGEGSSCAPRRHRSKPGSEWTETWLLITVKQSSDRGIPDTLLRLQSLFGGPIYKINMSKGKHLGKKQQYNWQVSNATARRAMARMIPYLGEQKLEQYSRARERIATARELRPPSRRWAK